MSSLQRRRSASRSFSSRSSGSPAPKSKRSLDLVSTRRITPQPHYFRDNFRGRSRPYRRPFYNRGNRGYNYFRGNNQRFYHNGQRGRFYNNYSRDDFHVHKRYNRRSRSRSRGHSRVRSMSRDRDRRRSVSESSSSSSTGRSLTPERTQSKVTKVTKPRSPSPELPKAYREKPRPNSDSSTNGDDDDSCRSVDGEESSKKQRLEQSLTLDKDKRKQEKVAHHKSKAKKKKKKRSKSSSSEERPKKKKKKVKSGNSDTMESSKPVYLGCKLHTMFSLISQDIDFALEEDISIAIQRNPFAEPSEDSTVRVVFDPDTFIMHYSNSGAKNKPIFDRPEIKAFVHDKVFGEDGDFERRVIRVKPAGGKSSLQGESSKGNYFSNAFKITRTIKRESSLSSSSSSSPEKIKKGSTYRPCLPADDHFEAQDEKSLMDDSWNDLYHQDHASVVDPQNDLISRRKPDDSRGYTDRDNRLDDGRNASDVKTDRHDKYQYTPWLDQPELIPKDPKYFMHDDRERENLLEGGRGHFFRSRTSMGRLPFRAFRGRSSYTSQRSNFNYRGRGGAYSPHEGVRRSRSPPMPQQSYMSGYGKGGERLPEREWKHDKYSVVERDIEHQSDHDKDQQQQHHHQDKENSQNSGHSKDSKSDREAAEPKTADGGDKGRRLGIPQAHSPNGKHTRRAHSNGD